MCAHAERGHNHLNESFSLAHPAQRRWYPLVFAIAALVLMPLSVLLLSWQIIDHQIWSHLWDTQMPRLLGNTLTLVLGVGVGVTLLGLSLIHI